MSRMMHFFPLSIYQAKLPMEEAERGPLVQAIVQMAQDRVKQTAPGISWTGDLNGYELLHNDPRFAGLFARFAGPLNGYLEAFRLDTQKVQLHFTRSWGTLSRRGDSTQAHSHMQSHLSLVYYLSKPPGSCGISFIDKRPPNQFAPNLFDPAMLQAGVLREHNPLNTQKIYVEPEQDDVLIFPSHALHEIPRNPDEGVRVSIACDIVITLRRSSGLEYLMPDPTTWRSIG